MITGMFFANLNQERRNEALNLRQGFHFAYTFMIGRKADAL